MKWIFNTDLFSMENDRFQIKSRQRPSVPLAEALMTTVEEGDVVIGDPTNFNIKDEFNEFDQGWDLEGDEVYTGPYFGDPFWR